MMDAEMMQVISTSIRLILVAGVNMGVATFVTNVMLVRRRSLLGISLYWAVKILTQSIALGYVLPYYYGQTEWIGKAMVIMSSIFAVLTFVMYCYTFTGGLLKIAIAAMLGNIVTAFLGYFSMALVNLAEGREDIWGLFYEFELMDLAIPAVDIALLLLLYHYTASFLYKFRDYELQHRTFLWGAFVSFVIFGTMTTVSNTYDTAGPTILLVICITIFVIGWMVLKYYRSLRNKQIFLTAQKKMAEAYYEVIRGQISEIEAKQQEIDSQMREISKMQNSVSDAERIACYISVLRQNYEDIKTGVYCNNWTMDAVLYTQGQILKKQGIAFDCKLQECDLGKIEEEDFLRMLLILLEIGAHANQRVKRQKDKVVQLRAAAVRNQLIIEFVSGCERGYRLSRRIFSPYIKRYQGTVEIKREAHKLRFMLALQKG